MLRAAIERLMDKLVADADQNPSLLKNKKTVDARLKTISHLLSLLKSELKLKTEEWEKDTLFGKFENIQATLALLERHVQEKEKQKKGTKPQYEEEEEGEDLGNESPWED
jgi:hypothetical protein